MAPPVRPGNRPGRACIFDRTLEQDLRLQPFGRSCELSLAFFELPTGESASSPWLQIQTSSPTGIVGPMWNQQECRSPHLKPGRPAWCSYRESAFG
eukprot:4860723-Amphidinium_carterae.1